MKKSVTPIHWLSSITLLLFLCLLPIRSSHAQDYVTGSFEGEVKDSRTGIPIVGATIRIINQETGVPVAKQTDSAGRFRQGLLPPGDYTITVVKEGYVALSLQRSLPALRPTVVLPPVPLVAEGAVAATPTATPDVSAPATASATPAATGAPGTNQPITSNSGSQAGIQEQINTIDARRGGEYTETEVSKLPLGATTVTRSFDELGLLLPGVALPPQTLGSVSGPGVGPGVGSAGQFSVNGLRSRANNFTVDGSDNNDEDIGVRRQGFLALVPQPIESIKEFQMITLLAPAQFGRNFGAQVNAISKSGGNDTHGAFFGFLNSSQLNARNAFDQGNGNATSALRANGLPVLNCFGVTQANCLALGRPITVQDLTGGQDSLTLGQGGLVLGGKLVPDKVFYFFSMEGQRLNATQEASFAVPTVAQRGAFGTGASGIFRDPFGARDASGNLLTPAFAFPSTVQGDAIFSLFPFANNPNGVYGENTFTQVLPAGGQGKVISGKVDSNWQWAGRQQSFTARYNFTDDWRDIPVTGGALFSTLRPRVGTQNFSTFLNSELSNPSSTRPLFNQLRLSYGRTRLIFNENRDTTFLRPSGLFPETPFLLNAPLRINNTLPDFNAGNPRAQNSRVRVDLIPFPAGSVEDEIGGPIGQVIVAGFSPIGVDVNNFPQRRVNNTYQLADTLTWRLGGHNLAFGIDFRRTELNSDLPRNARPLITFNGAPEVGFNAAGDFGFTNRFLRPETLVAASAPSGFFQSLVLNGRDATINLRYYQYDFFVQDEWRIRQNLSLSFGLRYEYNTPPRETNEKIESTFDSALLSEVPGLRPFIAGRTGIFDADKNNFAPRVGFAYSPKLFGKDRATVVRAGYGLFYDQILGAVVSQSRNVFPTFLTINLAGGLGSALFPDFPLQIQSPSTPFFQLINPGTLNTLHPNFSVRDQIRFINFITSSDFAPRSTVFGFTLPARQLDTPAAHHYAVTLEQQLSSGMVLSAGYVGTQGRNLLRSVTPNLGPNAILLPVFGGALDLGGEPQFFGIAVAPGSRITAGDVVGGRPVANAGSVSIYETTASSRYDALQVQLRGRYNLLGATQFQVSYTFSKVEDDVSDAFDLAGASALPQNSLTFAGERGPANFDVRHRLTSNYISDFSSWGKKNSFLHAIFNGLEIAGTGTFQTGQPFTVNSIFDVNLDGNLTDRLNSTTGIVVTGDRSQPLQLTVPAASLLAPVGQDGAVGRNSFRAGNLWLTNAAVIKTIRFSEDTRLIFRTEVFNLFNRANFGVPVRFLESPGFGRATETVTPARRIQFGLKLAF